MGSSSSKQKAADQVKSGAGNFKDKLYVKEEVMDYGIDFVKEMSGHTCGTVGAVIALLTALGKLDEGVANFIEGASADVLKRDAELMANYMKATLAAVHVAADLSSAVADASEQVQNLSVAMSMLSDKAEKQNAFKMIKSINSEKLVLSDNLLEQLQGAIQDYQAVITLCEGKLKEELKHANKKSDRYFLLSALCMFGAVVVIGATIAVPLAAPAALAVTYGLIITSAVAITAAGVVAVKAASHIVALEALQGRLREQEELVKDAEKAAGQLKLELKVMCVKVQAVQRTLRQADSVVGKVRVYGEHATDPLLTLDVKMILADLTRLHQAASKLHTTAVEAFHDIAKKAKWNSALIKEIEEELDALMDFNSEKAGGKK